MKLAQIVQKKVLRKKTPSDEFFLAAIKLKIADTNIKLRALKKMARDLDIEREQRTGYTYFDSTIGSSAMVRDVKARDAHDYERFRDYLDSTIRPVIHPTKIALAFLEADKLLRESHQVETWFSIYERMKVLENAWMAYRGIWIARAQKVDPQLSTSALMQMYGGMPPVKSSNWKIVMTRKEYNDMKTGQADNRSELNRRLGDKERFAETDVRYFEFQANKVNMNRPWEGDIYVLSAAEEAEAERAARKVRSAQIREERGTKFSEESIARAQLLKVLYGSNIRDGATRPGQYGRPIRLAIKENAVFPGEQFNANSDSNVRYVEYFVGELHSEYEFLDWEEQGWEWSEVSKCPMRRLYGAHLVDLAYWEIERLNSVPLRKHVLRDEF